MRKKGFMKNLYLAAVGGFLLSLALVDGSFISGILGAMSIFLSLIPEGEINEGGEG